MQLPYHPDEAHSRSPNEPLKHQLLPSPHLDSTPSRLQDASGTWLLAPPPRRSVWFTREGSDDEVIHGSSDYAEEPISMSLIHTSQEQVDCPGLTDSNKSYHPTNPYDWMHPLSPMLTHSQTIGDLPQTPPPRPQRPYHCAISRNSPPLSRIQCSRPLPIIAPTHSSFSITAGHAWPSPTSFAGDAEQSPGFSIQCPSPQHTSPVQHYLVASGDLRTALTLTTSDLRMSKSAHITRFEEYLAKQPGWSTDNTLEICTSRDVLDYGETMQNTFRHINGFLRRFSKISISLRNEPDSPDPSGLGLIFDRVDHSRPGAAIDLKDAVNLKEFAWRGSALSLTETIIGLPKHNITSLCVTDCQISLNDASIIVKLFPNLEHLEIDMIDDCADNVLHLSPLLSPTLVGSSRIDHLKITSSAPLQGFLQDIKFLDSSTSLKSIQLIPYGFRRDILPDKTSLERLSICARK